MSPLGWVEFAKGILRIYLVGEFVDFLVEIDAQAGWGAEMAAQGRS